MTEIDRQTPNPYLPKIPGPKPPSSRNARTWPRPASPSLPFILTVTETAA